MAVDPRGAYLLGPIRAQMIVLLRRANATVSDLSAALGLSTNAVRAHLATLARAGLVRQVGLRRGERKPSQIYALTTDAELLFPKAYGLILCQVLAVFHQHVGEASVEAALRETGRQLATNASRLDADLSARVSRAAALIDAFGGLTEVTPANGGYVIDGLACPLADVSSVQPMACRLLESFVAEVTGAQVRERCERGTPPRCRLEVTSDYS